MLGIAHNQHVEIDKAHTYRRALADAQAMLQGLNPEEDTRILRQPPRRKAPPSDVPRGQEPLSPAEVPELPPRCLCP